MKTLEINSVLKADVMLVELSEKAREPKLFNDKDRPYISYFEGMETPRFYLPEGDWKDLGFVSDLKENEVESFVEKVMQGQHFQNYNVRKSGKIDWANLWTKTALESFLSLLETEIHFENPVKVHTWASENADEYRKQFDDAQSHTFDKDRTLVFAKPNQSFPETP